MQRVSSSIEANQRSEMYFERQTDALWTTAELKALASWVRNKSGMKVKSGILGGSRVEYFKGKSIRFHVDVRWPMNNEQRTTNDDNRS
jgi:hypothetical protein